MFELPTIVYLLRVLNIFTGIFTFNNIYLSRCSINVAFTYNKYVYTYALMQCSYTYYKGVQFSSQYELHTFKYSVIIKSGGPLANGTKIEIQKGSSSCFE